MKGEHRNAIFVFSREKKVKPCSVFNLSLIVAYFSLFKICPSKKRNTFTFSHCLLS